MPYSLRRVSDGAGDSGPLCQFFRYTLNEEDQYEQEFTTGEIPVIGYGVRVGSLYARSFVAQDYWQTTPVTEIIVHEERVNDEGNDYTYVRFKTGNSEYEWKWF